MTRPTLRLLEYRFQFFQKEVLAAKAAKARHDMQQLARFEAAARSKAKKSELRKVEKVAPQYQECRISLFQEYNTFQHQVNEIRRQLWTILAAFHTNFDVKLAVHPPFFLI